MSNVPSQACTSNLQSKITKWLPALALLLVIGGQLNYLPDRLAFFGQVLTFAWAENETETARLAYRPADYDVLEWVRQTVSPDATLLLLTAAPRTYGHPSYVFYHRAIYHLAPRSVWWAAPVPATRYPAWWSVTDLSRADILALARRRQAAVILADGFARPPIAGDVVSFDADTYLIFLDEPGLGRSQRRPPGDGQSGAMQRSTRSGRRPVLRPNEASNGSAGGDRRWLILFGTAGAILSILAWGDVVYQFTGGPFAAASLSGSSIATRLAVAWLWGCGATSFAAFMLLWAAAPLHEAIFGLSLAGFLLWLVASRRMAARLAYGLGALPASRRALRSPPPVESPRKVNNGLASLRTTHYALCSPYSVKPEFWRQMNFRGFSILHLSRLLFKPWSLLFSLILFSQISLVAWAALARPLIDWDAWVNWTGKANLLFIEQTLSANIYNNPARLPTNLDYPLLLPLVEAWFYSWLGRIHEPSAGLVAFLFYGALLLLFYRAARLIVSPTVALGFTALLATVPRLERIAAGGLADVPLAALVVLTFLSFPQTDRLTGRAASSRLFRATAMLALTAGLLPWLKNEGWLWLGIVTICWLGWAGLKVRNNELSPKQAAGLAGVYLLIAAAVPSLWQIFLTIYGTQRFTFLPVTPFNLFAHWPRYPVIVWEIAGRLLNPYWNFVWLLTGLTLLLRYGKIFQADAGWLIIPISLYLVLISATYIFSRFDPYLAHLNNSVERLAVQAVPLVVWWLVGQSAGGSNEE